jgi:dTDP-4-dehydrorhamnose 3,5-epimerase
VFRLSGRDTADVTPISTEQYVAGREGISPRPANSLLDLSKIEATGFKPADQLEQLEAYCRP